MNWEAIGAVGEVGGAVAVVAPTCLYVRMIVSVSGRRAAIAAVVVSMTGIAFADDAAPAGAVLLQPFKQQLRSALQTGMAYGPAAAIESCRVEAPAIAASFSVDGIRMGRTSHRPRNPANEGPAWAAAVLQSYLGGDDWKPRTVDLGEGRSGYIEPIRTHPLCLHCHGETLSSEVADAIRQLYPQDRATGFRAGDLRGVFWVSYPTR